MLWFLRTAAKHDVVVLSYADKATGTQRVEGAGSGPFVEVVLRPQVSFAEPGLSEEAAARLHREAREHNHVARSVSLPGPGRAGRRRRARRLTSRRAVDGA